LFFILSYKKIYDFLLKKIDKDRKMRCPPKTAQVVKVGKF